MGFDGQPSPEDLAHRKSNQDAVEGLSPEEQEERRRGDDGLAKKADNQGK